MHVCLEEIEQRAPLFARCGAPKHDVECVNLAAEHVKVALGVAPVKRITQANRVLQ